MAPLSREEEELCQIGLAYVILGRAGESEAISKESVAEAILETRENLSWVARIEFSDDGILREFENFQDLMDSTVLKRRFHKLALQLKDPASLLPGWIRSHGWDLVERGECFDTILVLSRINDEFAQIVLFGLHSLATRLALELVDSNGPRLVAQSKR